MPDYDVDLAVKAMASVILLSEIPPDRRYMIARRLVKAGFEFDAVCQHLEKVIQEVKKQSWPRDRKVTTG